MLSLDDLRERVKKGEIEHVVTALPDMYGRLMGKRFDADFFLESVVKDGTEFCAYLFTCDINNEPKSGYAYINCHPGFGDFHVMPDWTTLRLMSWENKTAIVIGDPYDEKQNDLVPVPYAPRTILRKQVEAVSKLSLKVLAASELEFYTCENSYRDARALNYEEKKLKFSGDYPADYHLLQTAREEKYTARFRHHLKASGVTVQNSKGEIGIGQHELNIKYTDIFTMADQHVIYKQCLKGVAEQLGASVTFMAKPFTERTGSSCHIHLGMINTITGKNAFVNDDNATDLNTNYSPLFKHFLAGLLKYAADVMVFYAPTINSYKRYVSGAWAPTHIIWSYDNRMTAFRIVGKGPSLHIECRIPGADCNVYLAYAATLASGLRGIADQLELPPMFEGDIEQAKDLPKLPKTLKEAIDAFEKSAFVREAFGNDVVEHYLNFYRQEQEVYDKSVTDWERHRYFEQI